MAYLLQDYTNGNVLTDVQLDQIEENIKSHAHGTGDISPIATNLLLLSKYATLQAAITAIGATETTLILDVSKNASNSAEAVTVPATLSLFPMRGGMITKGSATTLTIISAPVGNPMHQWLSGFAGTTDLIFNNIDKIYVEWFGTNTIPGTTDMSPAFQVAFNVISNSTQIVTHTGNISPGTAPHLALLSTKYYIGATCTTPWHCVVKGPKTNIIVDSGVTAFRTVHGFMTLILEDIVFNNGGTSIEYDPTGSDTRMIEIIRCEFHQQTAFGIKAIPGAINGIELNIRACKFISSASVDMVPIYAYADSCNIEDCWISTNSTYDIVNYGFMNISRMIHAPFSQGKTVVKNYGSITVEDSRFGAENGGCVLVENHSSGVYVPDQAPSLIQILNCGVFSALNPMINFYAIPNKVILRDNWGTDNPYLKFDTSIPSADVYNFNPEQFINDGNVQSLTTFSGDETKYVSFITNVNASNTIPMAEYVKIGAMGGGNIDSTNCSASSGVNTLNQYVYIWTKTASNPSFSYIWPTLLSTLTDGTCYTAVFNIEVTGTGQATVTVIAGGSKRMLSLPIGAHTISLPFVRFSAGSQAVKVYGGNFVNSVNMASCRIFKGARKIKTQNIIVFNGAIPTDRDWLQNDKVISNNPTIGLPKSWVCTVAGAPGTWVSEGNL